MISLLVTEQHDAAQPRRIGLATLNFFHEYVQGKGFVLSSATAHVAEYEVDLAHPRILLQERSNILVEEAPLEHCVCQRRQQEYPQ